ncbi:MAG TPA: methyltransferase domain-containing protein [Candidatus Sulfopaludibacter sp.]|jgi:hypothetical protein|nr:methyltransferase domain-containing protein [Candidatus Sulfopaludibacter sp.]
MDHRSSGENYTKIIKISPRLRIGDFGCGKAKIMEIFGIDRVASFDHVAINDKVIACNMRSVPIEDGSLDVVIFCLSLMGKNWHEYIKEANRCLMSTGTLLVSGTVNAIEEGRLFRLKEILSENSFDIYKEEQWDVFFYIEARKR